MRIIDAAGNEQDWAWLEANYGPLVIYSPFANDVLAWRVVELRENRAGQNFILVTVLDEDGYPVVGQGITWYWPDAPQATNCMPPDGVPPGMTWGRYLGPFASNGNGQFGLAMFRGAQYEPPLIGPHATWICDPGSPGEVMFGLGWLLGTAYYHLDVTFQWSRIEEPPPPDDEVIAELLLAQAKNAEVATHIANALDLLT